MNIRHLGRFSFELPKQFELSEREQAIYGVMVNSTDKGTKSTQEHWQSNLHKIKSLDTLNLTEDYILPNIPSVFFKQKSLPRMITLSAQIENGESILTATLEGKESKKINMLELVCIVLKSYQHGDNFGFHVGSGTLLSVPGNIEYANATFKNKFHNIKFEASFDVAGDILSDDPLIDIDEDIPLFKKEGVKMKVLQKKQTKLNELQGIEYLISMSEKNKNKLFIYSWFFSGETGNFLKPEISIKALVPEKSKKYFEEYWNDIIHSLSFRE